MISDEDKTVFGFPQTMAHLEIEIRDCAVIHWRKFVEQGQTESDAAMIEYLQKLREFYPMNKWRLIKKSITTDVEVLDM